MLNGAAGEPKTMVPWLSRVRLRLALYQPQEFRTVNVAPPEIIVVPVPLMLDGAYQVASWPIVTVPAPQGTPDFCSVRWGIVTSVLKSPSPPEMTVVLTLYVPAMVAMKP